MAEIVRTRALRSGGSPAIIEAMARTPETFRRAFRRRMGVSPGEYRDRFRGALEGAA